LRCTPTKSEGDAISEGEDFGLKACKSYSLLLSSRSLPKIIKKFSGNFIA